MIRAVRLSYSARRIDNASPLLRFAASLVLALACLYLSPFLAADETPQKTAGQRISKEASDRCAKKVEALEAEAAKTDHRSHPTTRFSEEELNSYLALELKSRFHPCLKSLQVLLGEDSLDGTAEIDFDKLSASSTKTLTKMIARLFSGVHKLSVRGKLVAEGGKGSFQLAEAKFDDSTLPNFLVSEIITAVGKKQKPPFDPLQPSDMPYAIQKVDVHKGYIIVYQ